MPGGREAPGAAPAAGGGERDPTAPWARSKPSTNEPGAAGAEPDERVELRFERAEQRR
jgi:hypothetical protein